MYEGQYCLNDFQKKLKAASVKLSVIEFSALYFGIDLSKIDRESLEHSDEWRNSAGFLVDTIVSHIELTDWHYITGSLVFAFKGELSNSVLTDSYKSDLIFPMRAYMLFLRDAEIEVPLWLQKPYQKYVLEAVEVPPSVPDDADSVPVPQVGESVPPGEAVKRNKGRPDEFLKNAAVIVRAIRQGRAKGVQCSKKTIKLNIVEEANVSEQTAERWLAKYESRYGVDSLTDPIPQELLELLSKAEKNS